MGAGARVYVSHAADDVAKVRIVRNQLEMLGVSPVLFQPSLFDNPEAFWPLIEAELRARSFFLFCDSASAKESAWVQRERTCLVGKPTKRVATVLFEEGVLDLSHLADFVAATRVFPSYFRTDADRVAPFVQALRAADFSVMDDLSEAKKDTNWEDQINNQVGHAASRGWVVAFLSAFSIHRPHILKEVEASVLSLGNRFLAVLLDPILLPQRLAMAPTFDAFSSPAPAADLVRVLLTRQRT